MNRVKGMSGARRLVLALIIGGAVFGVASAVQASIPDASGVAHGCYYIPPKLGGTQQLPGDLRLIDTDKGQHCNSDEGSVSLATTGFVQGNVNQTEITGAFTFPPGTFAAGDHTIQWTCGGWIAVNPTVAVDPLGSSATQAPLTLHGMTNVESQTADANDTFGTTVRVFFNLSSAQLIHTQVQCVDPRVFGKTFPVAAQAQPTATIIN